MDSNFPEFAVDNVLLWAIRDPSVYPDQYARRSRPHSAKANTNARQEEVASAQDHIRTPPMDGTV